MRLKVDLLPHGNYADVVLVVDTLRATTTAIAYLESGADSLLLAQNAELALGLKDSGYIVAGERGGLAIQGFDFGNSPAEAKANTFVGRNIVMHTTNGTGAAHLAAKTGKHIFLAALTNAHAAARKAKAAATEEIAIVCSGTDKRSSIEDVYTAGVLAEYLLSLGEFAIDDGARIALAVRRSGATPLDAISSGFHGNRLIHLGLSADIHHAAEISTSTVVPTLSPKADTPAGTLRFVNG